MAAKRPATEYENSNAKRPKPDNEPHHLVEIISEINGISTVLSSLLAKYPNQSKLLTDQLLNVFHNVAEKIQEVLNSGNHQFLDTVLQHLVSFVAASVHFSEIILEFLSLEEILNATENKYRKQHVKCIKEKLDKIDKNCEIYSKDIEKLGSNVIGMFTCADNAECLSAFENKLKSVIDGLSDRNSEIIDVSNHMWKGLGMFERSKLSMMKMLFKLGLSIANNPKATVVGVAAFGATAFAVCKLYTSLKKDTRALNSYAGVQDAIPPGSASSSQVPNELKIVENAANAFERMTRMTEKQETPTPNSEHQEEAKKDGCAITP